MASTGMARHKGPFSLKDHSRHAKQRFKFSCPSLIGVMSPHIPEITIFLSSMKTMHVKIPTKLLKSQLHPFLGILVNLYLSTLGPGSE